MMVICSVRDWGQILLVPSSKVESRELNYDELDMELKELQKVIKNVNKSQGISFSAFYYNIHCKIYIILYMYNILYVLIFPRLN